MERITIFDNEDFLRQVSTPVDFQHDDYRKYISELRSYCVSHAVYALAPVQIGIPKRIIYIKNTSERMGNNTQEGYNEDIIYINPRIVYQKGHTSFLEACASCCSLSEGKQIYYAGVVDRPYIVGIEYYSEDEKLHTGELEGFAATVFCHEYDHLEGILHLDRTNEVIIVNYDEMRDYREKHKYEILSKTEDFVPSQVVKKKIKKKDDFDGN